LIGKKAVVESQAMEGRSDASYPLQEKSAPGLNEAAIRDDRTNHF